MNRLSKELLASSALTAQQNWYLAGSHIFDNIK